MVNSLKEIGETCKKVKEKVRDYECVKFLAKRRLGFIDPSQDLVPGEVNQLEKEYGSQIDDSISNIILYEEFLKEYITIFEAKKYLIDMIQEFEKQKNQDFSLDQAISKLTKPIVQEE